MHFNIDSATFLIFRYVIFSLVSKSKILDTFFFKNKTMEIKGFQKVVSFENVAVTVTIENPESKRFLLK